MKLFLCRIIILLVVNVILTSFVIYLHTPHPDSLIFDFKCLDTQKTCPVKIDENRKTDLKEKIDNAVRDSRRLGTLSDIYISVVRFQVNILNQSTGYVSVASSTPIKIEGDIQCLDGILAYGKEKEIEDDFRLSDSSIDLVASISSYVSNCPGFFISVNSLEKLPPVPPNSVVIFEAGPQFTPIFSSDLLSWVFVFIFNLLVLLGLLPLLREGLRFLRKGHFYFE